MKENASAADLPVTKAVKYEYRLKPAIARRHQILSDQIDEETVILIGPPTFKRRATSTDPEVEIPARLATQDDLKFLLEERKHPFIEKVEVA